MATRQNNTAIIIGAGIGGITTSIFLAQHGYKVKVLEKNAYPGGRCGKIVKDGHRFDIGATLLMMPDVYEKIYRTIGRNMHQELDLIRMDPIYKIKFHEGQEMLFSSDLAKLQQQLEAVEPGSYRQFLKYMEESYHSYKLSMKHIIGRNYFHFLQFFNLKNLLLLFKLKAFNNHYHHAGKYFKSDILKLVFTFQNIYVGQDPFHASAIFSMLPFLELTDGVWFPKGGMYQVIQNLLDISKGHGVELILNQPVASINVNGKAAKGVKLQSGENIAADIIVANADLPYAYQELLPDKSISKSINKLHYTCSAFMFHWGVKKVYPQIEQHNVYVSPDYKDNIDKIFHDKVMPDEPSFYLHSPARSDSTSAPDGQDSISAIVPVGHIDKNVKQDWKALKEKARKAVLRRLKKEGLEDFEEQIKFEICYTPNTWKSLFNLSRGATFGSLSHNLLQMGYMRPSNQHKKYRNLFFVGGSTHPGNGLPMALLSAKLTSEKILNTSLEPKS